jgi:rhomboid protease GluP
MLSLDHKKKPLLTILFLPAVILAGTVLIAYLILTKLLKFQMLKEDTLDYIVPLLMAWISCLIWMRPRLRILKTSDYRDANGNLFFTVLLVALPIMAVRQFTKKDAEKLIKLGSINDIVFESPFRRYFQLEYYYLDKQKASFVDKQDTRNKGSVRLFRRYYTVPILYSYQDTSRHKCTAWLGVLYERSVDNTKDESLLNSYLVDFNKYVEHDFQESSKPEFVYLEKLGNTYDKDVYMETINENQYYKNINQWGYREETYRVMVPINEPFGQVADSALLYLLASLALPLVYWFWVQTKKVDELALEQWMETEA